MKKRKPAWVIVLIISLLVVFLCAALLIFYFRGQPAVSRPSDATKDEAASHISSETDAVPSAAEETAQETQTPTRSFGYDTLEYTKDQEVSFDELMGINPDVYAWIYIPNTGVDYPVAQSMTDSDDSFYLSHNVYREYQFSGSIYSEIQNSIRFDDPVTVLYGHNMLNGSMFATLHYFEDEDFFEKNNTAFVYTRDKVLTYLIYSAYTFDDRHILNSFNMKNKESFREYLDSTLEPRSYNCNVRENMKLTTDDKILTLSTCSNGGGNTRYLVQGVLVSEQPRQR